MIEREFGETRLVCDECGDWQRDTYDREDFHRMIEDAKEEGWQIRSGRGGWTHTCPVCASEFDEVSD